MPVFRLPDEHIFPPPRLAEDSGLLAIGGDLSEARLLLAYSMGIFPWYADDDPILWWSPDPRLVLFPDDVKISRSLKQTINKQIFKVTLDTAFEEVIGILEQAAGPFGGGNQLGRTDAAVLVEVNQGQSGLVELDARGGAGEGDPEFLVEFVEVQEVSP